MIVTAKYNSFFGDYEVVVGDREPERYKFSDIYHKLKSFQWDYVKTENRIHYYTVNYEKDE